GIQPQTYAESILKVCEFYLGSPLVCVAGVTGSNLKKRIEEIMIHRITHQLELGKKLLLATVAVSALAAPVMIGLLHPTEGHAQAKNAPGVSPVFEDVLIQTRGTAQPKQAIHTGLHQNNELTQFTNFSLRGLVQYAYRLDESQVSGGPQWVTYDLFDVLTKTSESVPEPEYRLELQKLLADRFKLTVHSELKDLPVLELVVGKNGPKLKAAQEGGHSLSQKPAGRLEATRISISQFAELLGRETGKPVVDKTGLTGFYDFTLNWKSENTRTLPLDNTALLNALSEQLGLELQPATDPVATLVIDHAEKVIGQ
ncbi:MAG TPA: TIGR03435 family protein, partial [Candidatus Angelobacter sp.]|nr:TIGR03435 family protein [Candidatus Angelobacter sp.]